MNINKNNYEAFFLDYHEGNLSPQQVADLLLYLEQHPELKEEFESFENVTLEDLSAVTFENKSGLKKDLRIDSTNCEDYFIRSVENTLTPIEKTALTEFIKQHPQYTTDFDLFQKTKLVADTSLVFENKELLKRVVVTTDDLLIASVEGLLTSSETALLNQQIAVDAGMQHDLHLFKQTKLIVDMSIVYDDKDELKRKERRTIPIFYYVAVAASLLILFGLYFTFNKNQNEQKMANVVDPKIKNQDLAPKVNQEASIKHQEKNLAQIPVSNNAATKKSISKKQNDIINKKDSPIVPVKNNELPIANNAPVNIQQPIANNILPQNSNRQPTTNLSTESSAKEGNQSLAQVDKKNETNASTDFLSIKELAVEKLKEKTLDENSIASQKKNGRLKRFSGWDVAQIVTKGISKVTGRDLEIKPTYNDDGDVTAYALGNGIERTTGR